MHATHAVVFEHLHFKLRGGGAVKLAVLEEVNGFEWSGSPHALAVNIRPAIGKMNMWHVGFFQHRRLNTFAGKFETRAVLDQGAIVSNLPFVQMGSKKARKPYEIRLSRFEQP